MSADGHNIERSGTGFLGLLTIALVVLKLTVRPDLSWWLVTSPLWFVPGALILCGLAVLVGVGIVAAFEKSGKGTIRRG